MPRRSRLQAHLDRDPVHDGARGERTGGARSREHVAAAVALEQVEHGTATPQGVLALQGVAGAVSQGVSTAVGVGAAIGTVAIPVPVLGTAVGALVGFIASKASGALTDAILKNPDDVRQAVQIIHTEALQGQEWALNVFSIYGIGAQAALARDGWKTLGDAVGV